jgi:predicted negative regulator of RcsB-dependent stress response
MKKTLWKNNRPNKIDPKESNNNTYAQLSDLSQQSNNNTYAQLSDLFQQSNNNTYAQLSDLSQAGDAAGPSSFLLKNNVTSNCLI